MEYKKNPSSFEGKDAKLEGVTPSPVSLVAEEKVSFGLYALSVSSLTVARIRKVYNKLDSKAIAKQVSWVLSVSHAALPGKIVWKWAQVNHKGLSVVKSSLVERDMSGFKDEKGPWTNKCL